MDISVYHPSPVGQRVVGQGFGNFTPAIPGKISLICNVLNWQNRGSIFYTPIDKFN